MDLIYDILTIQTYKDNGEKQYISHFYYYKDVHRICSNLFEKKREFTLKKDSDIDLPIDTYFMVKNISFSKGDNKIKTELEVIIHNTNNEYKMKESELILNIDKLI